MKKIAKLPISDLFEVWLTHQVGTVESSRCNYRKGISEFFKYIKLQGVERADQVTTEHIVGYITQRQQVVRAATISGHQDLIRRFFLWCIEQGAVKRHRNPLPIFRRHRKSTRPRKAFTQEDYERILAYVSKPHFEVRSGLGGMKQIRGAAHYWQRVVVIAWHTGLRISDIARLTWENVDFDNQLLRVEPLKMRRFGQVLEIPIEPELMLTLEALRGNENPGYGNENYVLPEFYMAYKFNSSTLRYYFHEVVLRLGLNGSFHSFRHGFVTKLIYAGVSPIVIASMTGHSLEQLKTYAHPSLQLKADALAMARPGYQNGNHHHTRHETPASTITDWQY